MKPYVIVAPNFAHVCGGIRALHRLCHKLNDRGFPAYITGKEAGPAYEGFTNTRHVNSLSLAEREDIQHNGIVIYPEIVVGNPLRFNNVVHWWLIPIQYIDEHALNFSFVDHPYLKLRAPNNLCTFFIESFFKPPVTENRFQTCFRVHKGARLPRIPETQVPSCKEITGQFPATRQGVAQLLQTSSIFYTYDDLSGIAVEARLCGCPVKIIDYTFLNREILDTESYSHYGLATPEDAVDLDKLRTELPLFMEAYQKKIEHDEWEFEKFIDMTQDMHMPYFDNPCLEQKPQSWLPIEMFNTRS